VHDLLPLQYGADDARAPSPAIVRPVLLLVGVLHGVAAAGAVVPGMIVWLFQLDAGRWTFLFPQPSETLISAAAVFSISVIFAAGCVVALARPTGSANRWLGTIAFAYAGVWLAIGLSGGMLPLLTYVPRGRALPLTWVNYFTAIGATLCRELGQASLLLLILYAFGRRMPSESRVLRSVPVVAVIICAMQVLLRVFLTIETYVMRYAAIPLEHRLEPFFRDVAVQRFWTVGGPYLLTCLLALATFRRQPRLAGVLILLPFLVVEPLARGTLWTAFSVNSAAERTMTLLYDLAFLVFSATTPIAAFVLFTILGRRVPAGEADELV
jgi:hypothetical protein